MSSLCCEECGTAVTGAFLNTAEGLFCEPCAVRLVESVVRDRRDRQQPAPPLLPSTLPAVSGHSYQPEDYEEDEEEDDEDGEGKDGSDPETTDPATAEDGGGGGGGKRAGRESHPDRPAAKRKCTNYCPRRGIEGHILAGRVRKLVFVGPQRPEYCSGGAIYAGIRAAVADTPLVYTSTDMLAFMDYISAQPVTAECKSFRVLPVRDFKTSRHYSIFKRLFRDTHHKDVYAWIDKTRAPIFAAAYHDPAIVRDPPPTKPRDRRREAARYAPLLHIAATEPLPPPPPQPPAVSAPTQLQKGWGLGMLGAGEGMEEDKPQSPPPLVVGGVWRERPDWHGAEQAAGEAHGHGGAEDAGVFKIDVDVAGAEDEEMVYYAHHQGGEGPLDIEFDYGMLVSTSPLGHDIPDHVHQMQGEDISVWFNP